MSVGDLTDRLGLNHNAVRQHLAKLVGAGLVLEEPRRRRPAPDDPARLLRGPRRGEPMGVTGPYERLSSMLTEIIRTGETPVEIGRRVGRDEVADHGDDPSRALEQAMAHSGFEPTVDHQGDDIESLLHSCPFANAAVANPDIICELHRGTRSASPKPSAASTSTSSSAPTHAAAPCRLRAHLDPDRDAD